MCQFLAMINMITRINRIKSISSNIEVYGRKMGTEKDVAGDT
jgi:hypothetical protein